MPPRPIRDRPMTNAERQARWRERHLTGSISDGADVDALRQQVALLTKERDEALRRQGSPATTVDTWPEQCQCGAPLLRAYEMLKDDPGGLLNQVWWLSGAGLKAYLAYVNDGPEFSEEEEVEHELELLDDLEASVAAMRRALEERKEYGLNGGRA
jgi:hypothetical protein